MAAGVTKITNTYNIDSRNSRADIVAEIKASEARVMRKIKAVVGERRFEDWPLRLDAFIIAAQDRPFKWGTNDCGLFAADWILAATGIDPAAELRGKYTDALSAGRVAGPGGLLALAEGIAAAHGFKAQAPAFAQRGDVLLFNGAYGPTLGVCVGALIAGPSQDGLLMVPLLLATHAWRIA